ncbi:Type III pantothenate kinase [Anaerohalosphaera lusitana]|uniref:Type III pantothenate kinase n=1 Tax=Anaerohalosphaera lusitana TaxID=1936003 RepID=A0A1U9NQV8_9BACT|nr:type III pantothenate kinase [Anaerohalosphaera lusitana]AQT69896.1 Type III pantothenate kinase [Anaerohalosphaera lusitana]
MNILAIDIGNTKIKTAFFLDDREQFTESVHSDELGKLEDKLTKAWEEVPVVAGSTEDKRDGVIVVCSVNEKLTQEVRKMVDRALGEKIKVIGEDVRLPIEMGVENKKEVGTDRVVAAAAAFAVIEDAVVVADFGTAVTIDLVDEEGVFMGGVIAPGLEMGADALHEGTDKLPRVELHEPMSPVGGNTKDAINAGIYYGAVGLLRTMAEMYAEQVGRWPQTIVTGGGSEMLKARCPFVDAWVPDLVVKGIILAYKKHLADQAQIAEWDEEDQQQGKKDKGEGQE